MGSVGTVSLKHGVGKNCGGTWLQTHVRSLLQPQPSIGQE